MKRRRLAHVRVQTSIYAVLLLLLLGLEKYSAAQDLDVKMNTNWYAGRFARDYERGPIPLRAGEVSMDGEKPYGYVYACTIDRECRYAIMRPAGDIAEHWLKQIRADLDESRVDSPEYARSMLKAYREEPQSVWSRVLAIYCKERPQAEYIDIDGTAEVCSHPL